VGSGEKKAETDMNSIVPSVTQVFATRWGWAGLAATDQGLCVVILPSRSKQETVRALARALRRGGFAEQELKTEVRLPEAQRWVKQGVEQLTRFFEGTLQAIDLCTDLRGGTAFQRKVWRQASRIPYGRVRSYGWLATRLGGRQYARAVGLALGANPIPIVVPCHRIVSHDGSVGGFSCGVQVKRKLLALEGSLAQLK
jgi:O-6-methylguanine DNA methyltransferase